MFNFTLSSGNTNNEKYLASLKSLVSLSEAQAERGWDSNCECEIFGGSCDATGWGQKCGENAVRCAGHWVCD